MPIYEYKCQANSHRYQENRKADQPQSLKTCPKCGSDMLRVYGSPGIQFKGPGFYKTSE